MNYFAWCKEALVGAIMAANLMIDSADNLMVNGTIYTLMAQWFDNIMDNLMTGGTRDNVSVIDILMTLWSILWHNWLLCNKFMT